MSLLDLPSELLIRVVNFLLPMSSFSCPYLLIKNNFKQMAMLQSINSNFSEKISLFTNEFWWNSVECSQGMEFTNMQREKQALVQNNRMKRKCLQFHRAKPSKKKISEEILLEEIKVVVFGNDGASGQSCLIENYIYNNFQMSYDPTIEDSYIKMLKMNDSQYCLNIVDLATSRSIRDLKSADLDVKAANSFIIIAGLSLDIDQCGTSYMQWIEQLKYAKESLNCCPIIILIYLHLEEKNLEQKSTVEQWTCFLAPLLKLNSSNNFCFMQVQTRNNITDLGNVFSECVRRVSKIRDSEEFKEFIKNDPPLQKTNRCVLI